MYRTIDTKFWTDDKIRSLSVPEKLFALYLVTNPHSHSSGIYYLPHTLIAEETGIVRRTLDTLSDTLSSAGFARFDIKTNTIWVIRMMFYQGRGEKNERSAARQIETLHNSQLINEFLTVYPSVRQYVRDRVSIPYSEFGKSGTQEHKQEHKQELEIEHDCVPSELQTDGFRQVWAQWVARRKKKKWSTDAECLGAQLAELVKLGPDLAIKCIELSIKNGYQGIFPDKVKQNGKSLNGGPGQVHPGEPRKPIGKL